MTYNYAHLLITIGARFTGGVGKNGGRVLKTNIS